MQPVLFPRKRYFPSGAAAGVGLILNVLRQTTYGSSLLTAAHIEVASLAIGGLILGFLFADLTTPNSELRRWWRYRTRLFDVLDVAASFDHKHWGEQHTIVLPLRFVKPISNASVILKVQTQQQGSKSFDLANNLTKAEGSETMLKIATVDLRRPSSISIVWGDWEQPAQRWHLVGAYKFTAQVEVHTKGLMPRQAFSIYLETFAYDAATMGRFFYTDENRDILAVAASL